ncbi:hypothetical protein EYF80_042511 [Liparis tanakae]|uniref:Uncharacterized protein n=1 Tax=Liparis tanakae TaxID=230148 RepID=A0A4Z2G313_9TELE|nr:hypothetical protein EYF80_042511 [Liparis tanakae]
MSPSLNPKAKYSISERTHAPGGSRTLLSDGLHAEVRTEETLQAEPDGCEDATDDPAQIKA